MTVISSGKKMLLKVSPAKKSQVRHSEFALPTSSLKAKYAATKSHQEITMGASTKKKKSLKKWKNCMEKEIFFKDTLRFSSYFLNGLLDTFQCKVFLTFGVIEV